MRFMHIDENEDGTCTLTSSEGCLITFPCALTELGISVHGTPSRVLFVASRVIHTHIPDSVGPCANPE